MLPGYAYTGQLGDKGDEKDPGEFGGTKLTRKENYSKPRLGLG